MGINSNPKFERIDNEVKRIVEIVEKLGKAILVISLPGKRGRDTQGNQYGAVFVNKVIHLEGSYSTESGDIVVVDKVILKKPLTPQ